MFELILLYLSFLVGEYFVETIEVKIKEKLFRRGNVTEPLITRCMIFLAMIYYIYKELVVLYQVYNMNEGLS